MKKILLLAAMILACCGCAQKAGEEEKTGRYAEEQVELPETGTVYVELVQSGAQIRLVNVGGNDLLSTDGGRRFDKDGNVPPSYAKWQESVYSTAVSPDGDRLFRDGDSGNCFLLTADGREIEITGLDADAYPEFFYGEGCFYVSVEGREIYRLDPSGGELAFLLESEYLVGCLAAGEKYLYLAHADGVLIYDLEKGGIAERQDEALSFFVSENAGGRPPGRSMLGMYPYGNGIYLLLKSGLYWHELYGEGMEMVIDGDACGIGDLNRETVGLAVVEGGDTQTKPIFLVSYSDGTLERYAYDTELPARPEVSLRIYSIYEDGNVRQAVSSFRSQYPDVSVMYEVGVKTGYGVTEQDALKNLATEIAAGNGPDILVMDDLPFEAYLEKGVLMDLSPVLELEEYFGNIVQTYKSGSGLYAIPMSFFVPVLCGKQEKLKGVEDLADLANLLEAEREEGTSGSLISFWDAESALRLLSQSSQGAWMKNGNLDREAVADFLEQARRIYDSQMKEPAVEWDVRLNNWTGECPLEKRFGVRGVENAANHAIAPFSGQPFVAGYMSGSGSVYATFLAELEYLGENFGFCPMPGQCYGACLAVSVLAVNGASANMDYAKCFLEFAVSEEYQGEISLNGTSINKAAYLRQQADPREEPYADRNLLVSSTNAVDYDGTMVFVDIYWPTETQFQEADRMLNSITGVNQCDSIVYGSVIETGQKVLEGTLGVEEAVEEIGRKVQIYLAE